MFRSYEPVLRHPDEIFKVLPLHRLDQHPLFCHRVQPGGLPPRCGSGKSLGLARSPEYFQIYNVCFDLFITDRSSHDSLVSLRFLFQNVHKSCSRTHNLLESYLDSMDVVFIQEALFSHIRQTISTTDETGDEVFGPVHHAAWECVNSSAHFPTTQSCVYVNRRILTNHYISFDPSEGLDPNLLIIRLTRVSDGSTATMVCVYNPPATNNASVKALLSLLRSGRLTPSLI